MSGRRKRRSWKPQEKLRIVLAGLDGTIEISELCRREGINPTQYYSWKKQLTGSASQAFTDNRKKKSSSDDRLAAELNSWPTFPLADATPPMLPSTAYGSRPK